jgi:hypothetical protein
MKNAKKMMSLVGLFLAAAAPVYAQFNRVPIYHPPVQTYHPPAKTYHPPAQTSHPPAQTSHPPAQASHPPAQTPHPAQTYTPPAQTQQHPAPVQPRPVQPPSTPQRTTGSAPQPRAGATPPRQPAPSRKEVQRQQKSQVHAQKEQNKQSQKQQKSHIHQQREQQKQQQKQMKEQQKSQARQRKEQQKQQQKQPKSNKKSASSAKASKPRPAAASAAKPAASAAPKSSGTLTASQSQARIQRLNSARSNMSGVNRKPLPNGELTVHSNGRMTLKAEGGRQYGLRSNGSLANFSDREKTVSYDQRGKVSSIHTASMDIHNGAHGQRTVISRRADGSKVVSTGPHSGYVERNVVVNHQAYVQRTMVINNRVYTRTFVADSFGGVAFVPPLFFAPGFYGWAYHPWAAPIAFTWGWFGAPWYIGPNPYFVASPMNPSAAFWLTDYMIGETLSTAYQLHRDAAISADMMDDDAAADIADGDMSADLDANGGSHPDALRAEETTPISTDLKAEIAEQVKEEVAIDNAEAGNPSNASFDVLPTVLSKANHVFVVSSDLDVTTTDEQLCALQAGDMLQLMSPAAADSTFVQLRVASSKRTDCPAGVLVNVSLPDIQEMQNSFQAHIEAGLGKLHNNQGRAGLPSAPADAVAAPPVPAVTGLAPVPATDSSVMIDQEREQADQVEKQATSASF